MTTQLESPVMTVLAGEALEPYRRVKLQSTNDKTVIYADAGEEAIGVTRDRIASGDYGPINAQGLRRAMG